MDTIDIIKHQYFSQDNLNFILKLIHNNNSSDIDVNIIHEIAFKCRNNIFNSFAHTVYSQKKSVNPNSVEELLITLNKLTIDSIINSILEYQEYQEYQGNVDNVHDSNESNKNTVESKESNKFNSKLTSSVDTTTAKIDTTNAKIDKIIDKINDTTPNTTIDVKHKEYLDIFSCDNYFADGEYRLTINKSCKTLILKSIELYNNLYNITNCNNKIEIQQNNLKIVINIPPGCYNLHELLITLEKLLNERIKISKFKVTYNPSKNRINIESENTFSFRFIENDKKSCILLRYLLGFSQIEYINNNNYSSDQHGVVNIYDNIYIKIINPELVHMNKYVSKTFNYYEKLSFDYINTFNKTIKFELNSTHECNVGNLSNLSFEIYHRHILHDQFYKINSKLIFNMLFELY